MAPEKNKGLLQFALVWRLEYGVKGLLPCFSYLYVVLLGEGIIFMPMQILQNKVTREGMVNFVHCTCWISEVSI